MDANGVVYVNSANLAGNGLTPAAVGCSLDVNPGPGIAVVLDAVRFDPVPAAGLGLTPSGVGVELQVATGPGLEIVDDKVQVKLGCGLSTTADDSLSLSPPDIAGRGLKPADWPNNCLIEVFPGCGLKFSGSEVVVDPAALAGASLVAGEGCLLDFDLAVSRIVRIGVPRNFTLCKVDGTTPSYKLRWTEHEYQFKLNSDDVCVGIDVGPVTNQEVAEGTCGAQAPDPPGMLSGIVYEDAVPKPGYVVQLTPDGGTAITDTTDANGYYYFADKPPGAYTISVTNVPAGKQIEPPNGGSVGLTAGASVEQDFYITPLPAGAIILGDLNNPDTTPYTGMATVQAHNTGTNADTTASNVNGSASIQGLPAGTYTVTVTALPAGLVATPASASVTITATQATQQSTTPVAFTIGPAPTNGTISGKVTYANGSTALSGATIDVKNASGTVLATTTSDANGNYSVQAPLATSTLVACSKAGHTFMPASQSVSWTNNAFTANFSSTTVAPPGAPTITSLSPNSGNHMMPSPITIAGTNFTGATAVRFGVANAASFSVQSPTSITATPAGVGTAQSVQVTVLTAGGTSNGVTYTFT